MVFRNCVDITAAEVSAQDSIPIPIWQSGVVNSSNGGSTTLRNVPDVAMDAGFVNYVCSFGSCQGGWGGTSFAAPLWAAFMALVNQQAVEAGTAPNGGLGFLNPPLYSLGAGPSYNNDLHDITSGSSYSIIGTPYNAVAGYDLVTGWGSPNGANLINDLAGPQVPGFWLRPSAPSLQVGTGSSGSTAINITDAGGFTGNVTLAVTSPLPTGVTASWETNPASGSSVLTLTADSDAPASSTNLTITGTAGDLTATTTVALAVHPPAFLLAATPTTVGIGPGSTAGSAILVTPQFGFTGSVNLSISGLPSGVTASFSPTSTAGASLLTLTAGSSLTPGTSILTVTGTSGNLTVTTPLTLLVEEPSFTISAPSVLGVSQGSSAAATVQINGVYGFSGSVQLSLAGLPNGIAATLSSNPTTGTSTITVTAAANAALGTFPITINGASGSLTASTTFSVNIMPPTFVINTYPPQISLVPDGGSGWTRLTVVPEGFAGTVSLSVSGLPAGVTADFSKNPLNLSPGNTDGALLNLVGTSTAIPGTYSLTITGTSGSLVVSAPIILNVITQRPVPAIIVTPSSSSVAWNRNLSVTVGLSGGRGIPTGSVSLTGPGYTSSATLTGGSATFSIPAQSFPIGSATLTASYSGDENYSAATGSASVLVTQVTPGVTLSANPASITPARSPVLAVYVSGYQPYPTGTITLISGGSTLGTGTLTNGRTSITLAGSALAVGVDTVTASYTGDSLYNPAAGSTTVTVTVPVYGPVYPAQPAVNIGSVDLGGAGSAPTAIAFNFTTTETIGSTAVVTQGVQGLDFINAGGGTCDTNGSDHVYNAGDSCTVNVNFTPKYAGTHYGAVNLLDGSGNLLGSGYVYGTGMGPQLVFPNNTSVTTFGGGLVSPREAAVDGSGNIYVTDNAAVKEIPAGCVSASCVMTLGGGFVNPFGVAVDGSGNIYVGDIGNKSVKEIPAGCANSSCVMTLGGGFDTPGLRRRGRKRQRLRLRFLRIRQQWLGEGDIPRLHLGQLRRNTVKYWVPRGRGGQRSRQRICL